MSSEHAEDVYAVENQSQCNSQVTTMEWTTALQAPASLDLRYVSEEFSDDNVRSLTQSIK